MSKRSLEKALHNVAEENAVGFMKNIEDATTEKLKSKVNEVIKKAEASLFDKLK